MKVECKLRSGGDMPTPQSNKSVMKDMVHVFNLHGKKFSLSWTAL